jgi:hypothetical protein
MHYNILYQKYLIVLEVYNDADLNTLLSDSSYITSYVFILGGGIIC